MYVCNQNVVGKQGAVSWRVSRVKREERNNNLKIKKS